MPPVSNVKGKCLVGGKIPDFHIYGGLEGEEDNFKLCLEAFRLRICAEYFNVP